MKKRFIIQGLLVVFILVFQSSIGQIDHQKMVPPNPNVASLMKVSQTPVTEYAGLPNVGIPIYTISVDNINIPISLSYHTGGILVGEESGSVGLGWALNAGGVINRTINGFADFGENGSSSNKYYQGMDPFPDPVLTSNGNGTYFDVSKNAFIRSDANCNYLVNGVPTYFTPQNEPSVYEQDHLPDTYSYNFNGYSGSFVMQKDGSIYSLEKNGIKIKWQEESMAPGNNNFSFHIITEDGTKYTFNDWGRTFPDAYRGNSYLSTWYLTKITSINGSEIDFYYELRSNSYPLKTFLQSHYAPGSLYVNGAGNQVKIDDIYLTKIKFSNGEVNFNYSNENERLDIKTGYFLKAVDVKDLNKNIINHYGFNYSYFGKTSAGSGGIQNGDYSSVLTINPNNPSLNLRLKLVSISSGDSNHSFEYFEPPSLNLTPNKTSMSQDYWGFYNGITNPHSFIAFANEDSWPLSIKAKRYPVAAEAKLFSLKKITYPTKGYTEFDYESNTYNTIFNAIPTILPPTIIPTIAKSDYVMTNGGAAVVSKIISPKGINTKVKIGLAIYGSNVIDRRVGQHPFDFWNDMYVKYTNNESGRSYTQHFSSEQSPLDFENSGMVYLSATIDIAVLPIAGYTFEVYFNDHNKLYFGQAKVTVNWDQKEVDETKKYALGGGLRIKSITDFDHNTQKLRKRNFNYHYKETIDNKEVERSYGLLKNYPTYGLQQGYVFTPFEPQMGQSPTHTLTARVTSGNSLSKDMGSYVGYDQVTVTHENELGKDNGKTISKFYNNQDFAVSNNIDVYFFDSMHKFPNIRLPQNGKMYRKEHYKRNLDDSYTLVSATDIGYKINGIDIADFDYTEMFKSADYLMTAKYQYITDVGLQNNCLHSTFQFHPLYVSLLQQDSQKETIYDLNGNNLVVTTQNFFYENNVNHFERTRIETIDSEEAVVETKIYYPDDISTMASLLEGGNLTAQEYSQISKLKAANSHRINTPIQTVSKKDGQLLAVQRNVFDLFDGIVLPSVTKTAKGSGALKERLIFHDYENGKPVHISKKDGMDVCYIWGYNGQYPIAKIENLAYSNIPTSTISNLQNKSNQDNSATSENILRAALDGLRTSYPNAIITTYTYDPLIGVTSITDPRGQTVYYRYDDFNRLEFVRNAQGQILSKNEYHYKGQ